MWPPVIRTNTKDITCGTSRTQPTDKSCREQNGPRTRARAPSTSVTSTQGLYASSFWYHTVAFSPVASVVVSTLFQSFSLFGAIWSYPSGGLAASVPTCAAWMLIDFIDKCAADVRPPITLCRRNALYSNIFFSFDTVLSGQCLVQNFLSTFPANFLWVRQTEEYFGKRLYLEVRERWVFFLS